MFANLHNPSHPFASRYGRAAIVALLAAAVGAPASAHADTVRVKNKALTGSVTLSDLTVYDEDGNSEVILKANDDTDDEELSHGVTISFDTTLMGVTRYDISVTTVKEGEIEWKKGHDVTVAVPKEISYFVDPDGERPVHCVVFDPIGDVPPDAGAFFFIEDGASPELPGLFFGLVYDPSTGEVLEPYTGPATVLDIRLEVVLGGACRADIDGDGRLTIFDFLEFQNLFVTGSPIADFDGDGRLTVFDFLAFQNEFVAGCPG